MSRDPDTLETEIERTRARIENKLDTLGSELHPAQLMERAFGTDPNATAYETFENIAERARRSPVATALIGAGLVGLFLAGRKDTQPVDPYTAQGVAHVPPRSSDPAERVATDINRLKGAATEARDEAAYQASLTQARVKGRVAEAKAGLHEARYRAEGYVDSATETVSELAGSARETISDAAEATQRYASEASRRAAEAARAAPVQARAQGEAIVDWVKENPVPTGLFALAAGAAVSSLIAAQNASRPKSRYEASRELHEEAREQPRAPEPVVAPTPRRATAAKSASTGAAKRVPAKRGTTKPAVIAKTTKVVTKKPAKAKPSKKPSATQGKTIATAPIDRDVAVLGSKSGSDT